MFRQKFTVAPWILFLFAIVFVGGLLTLTLKIVGKNQSALPFAEKIMGSSEVIGAYQKALAAFVKENGQKESGKKEGGNLEPSAELAQKLLALKVPPVFKFAHLKLVLLLNQWRNATDAGNAERAFNLRGEWLGLAQEIAEIEF
ncbi:MAG: hypothetical protein HW383_538 [Candidatus Magasanikbacteria bacterium]|nr:hypothetical protein [Candidatus Magasanikbacteria bacterium]